MVGETLHMKESVKILVVVLILILSSFSARVQKKFRKFSNNGFELVFLENKKYSFSAYNYKFKKYEKAFGTLKYCKSNKMILEITTHSEDLYDSVFSIRKSYDKFDTVLTMQKVDHYFTINNCLFLTFVNDSILKVYYKKDTMTLYSHSKEYYNRRIEEYY